MGKPSIHDLLKWVRGWRLDKFFHHIKEKIADIAVAATQAVKTAAEGQFAQSIALVLDNALHTHIAEDALALIKIAAVKALAIEVDILNVPDNVSGDDLLKLEQEIFAIISSKTEKEKSKVWTSFGARLYDILKEAVGEESNETFAEIAKKIEEAYQKLKADLEAANEAEG